MADKPNFASVISNPGFLNLWINQILVQLSFNALNFTLIIWVFKLTDSNTAVSALLLAIYLPAVILGLFSGILVDIIDRKKIIMTIDFFLSLLFFSLIFLKGNFPAILVVTFFINALAQFYSPAEASAIPLVVKKNELLTANSLFSATLYSAFLIGFSLAGPLITHLGINVVFELGGGILAIAFLLSLMFPSIKSIPDTQGKKLILALARRKYSEIKEIGIFEIRETIGLIKGKLPVLTSIVILAGVQMGIGIMAVLAPGFLEKSLQIKATDASYVLIIPLGLGIVTGGIFLGRFGGRLIKRKLVSRAILFCGLLLFLVGIAPLISPAINYFKHPRPVPFIYQPPLSKVLAIGSFLIGMAVVSILIPSQTVLQENTPERDRGKVFSVLGVAMSALSLVPVFAVGILADVFGTTPIFIGLGFLVILAGLFGLSPSLFFRKRELSYRVREFLGLGHWEGK
ncbi:MAG: MFS transporter [Candidatus Daviesbacteria bacterium]|nr:MFS transporter [Candidatus Daviesbacteria bacterium]